jgi:putative transposase
MARLPRYFIQGVPLHIILRGNNREPIFVDDDDAQFFKDALHEAAGRNGLEIHAYVLMANHIHLLASPASEVSMPRTLQSVGRRYVQYFNLRYQRTGTLWEGRYRATIVDAQQYLFDCMRYIELNPVRAGMVRHARDYRWSSYRANGEGRDDALVSPHGLYRRLAKEETERRAAYRELVRMPMGTELIEEIRDRTNKGWALGSERFRLKVEHLSERRAMPLPKGRPKRVAAE